ncbi:Glycosyl phosphatidyl inositol anchor synthesis [Microbotryomycetes sp. JL201]|nr:Glycosyl phosphatidyl inositol anchor synthesis [Microbotryomycetes sp. JL201]
MAAVDAAEADSSLETRSGISQKPRTVSGPPGAARKRASTRFGGAASFLCLSLVFHVIYIGSIFDIYFKSPVTKGIPQRYRVEHSDGRSWPLAKRVVLIVGDGLRADKLFQTYPNPPFHNSDSLPPPLVDTGHSVVQEEGNEGRTTPAPFLRGLIQRGQARWGVSHTRVPTESRPGHVALIGGMYEDVSAVTRGWTTNPVAFDSVFNQSSSTFSFGSPDILPMFQQGASEPSRVQAWSYGEEYEDFSSDAVHLDLWCLDKLEQLIKNSSSTSDVKDRLDGSGVVFFLHLLGLDTTGHSYRPHGPEYHRNIRAVDQIVEHTSNLLREYYGDEDTAFVFTADHGMSSKGNHGDGEPDNTRTPLVVWGKGVGGENLSGGHDAYSRTWGLHGARIDVEQADVASVLGGLPIPANSAGRVPLSYLDASPEFKARAAFANAQQILAEYQVKRDTKAKRSLSFRPFAELTQSSDGTTRSLETHRAQIQSLIESRNFARAQAESMELVDIGLRGLRYFQTYDWLILQTLVSAGYAGFIVYSAKFIIKRHVIQLSTSNTTPSMLASALGFTAFAVLATRFYLEESPPSYYLYALFPCFFWSCILRDLTAFRHLRKSRQFSVSGAIQVVLASMAVLQAMVFGYTSRRLFAYLLVGMAFLWPLFGMTTGFRKTHTPLIVCWIVSCLLLAVFPMLPVEKGESIPVILSGGATFLVLGQTSLKWLQMGSASRRPKSPTLERAVVHINFELLLTGICMAITAGSAHSLQLKKGLPLFNQVAGWAILVTSVLSPVVHGRPRGQPYIERLLVLLFAFGPAFVILSLSYETLFFSTLCTTLVVWLELECTLAEARRPRNVSTQSHGPTITSISSDHVRIALFFLAFLHISFFGVGNVASISSASSSIARLCASFLVSPLTFACVCVQFYLEPVYRLIPIFAPFPMAALLLFKLLTPFVALSSVTTILNHRLRLPPFALFMVASTLSEYLTVNFFFLVTDRGSWLEIGSSITNFAICSLLGIFNTILYLGGEYVLAGTTDNVNVDLFELLPTPFGLARFGVAPDHPEVKNCQHKFEETARDRRFRFFGNVQVGGLVDRSQSDATGNDIVPNLSPSQHAAQINLSSLKPHYDAILLTYGASLDKPLGVSGEDSLLNVLSARTFVNWYNGHPYHSSLLAPLIDLTKTKHVTVIGQGNVALDVARILLKKPDQLNEFDVPEPVLEQLRSSKVERVDIVGRRGPLQLACTTKEVREMMNLDDVAFQMDDSLLQNAVDSVEKFPKMEGARMRKRLIGLLKTGSKARIGSTSKSWSFDFLKSPVALIPDQQETGESPKPILTAPQKVGAVEWAVNELVAEDGLSIEDVIASDPGRLSAKPTGTSVTTSTDLILKSVGYRSFGLPGLPFDERKGIVRNAAGRVIDKTGQRIPGLYTSGWLARGPTGVIATTMFDAFATADIVAQDIVDESTATKPRPELDIDSLAKGRRVVSWQDWEAIDQEERRRGQKANKLREKITDVGDMLKMMP